MRPALKAIEWERHGDDLLVVHDVRQGLVLSDPNGSVERLFHLLRCGRHDVRSLALALALPVEIIEAALATLDAHRLLEDAAARNTATSEWRERHFSNLAFFESFATLSRSQEQFVHHLEGRHVLVLGTGGLNSNVVPHLCGFGVGTLTLVDSDTVQPRNFARQYLYRWEDIGRPKVACAAEWVRRFEPTIKVEALNIAIASQTDVDRLLNDHRPDLVASGVDRPAEIDDWVNAACVTHDVPYVRAGMTVTQGVVRSVLPRVSGCFACRQLHIEETAEELATATDRLHRRRPRTNRGIGPVAGLLGALTAFEILRILTGFDRPAYAGRDLVIDFADACTTQYFEWRRHPACRVCREPEAPATLHRSGPDRRPREEVSG
jgi:molybdopterin/thiamine biosynthesis adenylyltransferase